MIITAVAELLGDRRLREEEEERMVVISLSYLFDRGISVCCRGGAATANLPFFYFAPPPIVYLVCTAGCLLAGRPVSHFIIGRGRVRGREGIERDDVTLSARLCIAQPSSPCSASTHRCVAGGFHTGTRQSPCSQEPIPFHQRIGRFMNPRMT